MCTKPVLWSDVGRFLVCVLLFNESFFWFLSANDINAHWSPQWLTYYVKLQITKKVICVLQCR